MAFQEACVQFLEILCHVLQQLESLLFAVQMKPCLYHSSRSEGRRPERIHRPTAIHARTPRDKLRCVGLRPDKFINLDLSSRGRNTEKTLGTRLLSVDTRWRWRGTEARKFASYVDRRCLGTVTTCNPE